MADNLPPLPAGFTLDVGPTKTNAAKNPTELPPLPPGYALDQPARIEKAGFLPFNKNLDTGEVSFDPTAGLLGSIISGFTAPGDVVSGKLDPNSPEGIRRAMDTTGLIMGGNPAVASGDRAIPGVAKNLRPGTKAVPTAEALKEASEAGYNAVKTMGVDYASVSVKNLADDLARELNDQGILAELTPKTFSILRKLQEPPENSVAGIEGLVAARRALNNAAGDFTNPTERLAATHAINKLDEFLGGSAPESVVAGPAPAAAKALEDARGNYAAAKRSERVTGAADKAELNAAVANSGLNVGNQIRQRLRDILTRPKDARGYSKEELALIEQIARGTLAANTMRHAGNLLGGGGGMGQAVTSGLAGVAGYAMGGPETAAAAATLAPLLGVGLRTAGNKLTQSQVAKLDELIRMRSPLYQQTPTPMNAAYPGMADIINRALMLQALSASGQPTQ